MSVPLTGWPESPWDSPIPLSHHTGISGTCLWQSAPCSCKLLTHAPLSNSNETHWNIKHMKVESRLAGERKGICERGEQERVTGGEYS